MLQMQILASLGPSLEQSTPRFGWLYEGAETRPTDDPIYDARLGAACMETVERMPIYEAAEVCMARKVETKPVEDRGVQVHITF